MRRREGSIPRRGNYKCEGNETAGQEADGEMEASFFLGGGGRNAGRGCWINSFAFAAVLQSKGRGKCLHTSKGALVANSS